MGKKRGLTWHKARCCWKKVYRAKVYYLSKSGESKGPEDKAGYEKALLKWLQIKAELTGEATPTRGQGVRGSALSPNGLAFASHLGGLSKERTTRGKVTKIETLEGVIEAFLAERRAEAERGELSIATYRESRDKLADFQSVAKYKGIEKMEQVDAYFLNDYRKWTLTLPPILKVDGSEGQKIGPFTAKKRLKAVRMLVEWAYEREHLDSIPRNIRGKYTKIKLPDPDPQAFTLEEVRELYGACSERVKLYFLLALNCGYGPQDIATLTHSQIFLDERAIHRTRNKTGSPQHHKLWKVTAKRLKEGMTDPRIEDLALLDAIGNPLVVERLDAKTAKTNPIGKGFYKATVKLGWTGGGKGIKVLRKTGATILAKQFPATPHIVKQYLGHKEQDVVRHYRPEQYELLWNALDWMEGYFNLK